MLTWIMAGLTGRAPFPALILKLDPERLVIPGEHNTIVLSNIWTLFFTYFHQDLHFHTCHTWGAQYHWTLQHLKMNHLGWQLAVGSLWSSAKMPTQIPTKIYKLRQNTYVLGLKIFVEVQRFWQALLVQLLPSWNKTSPLCSIGQQNYSRQLDHIHVHCQIYNIIGHSC